MFRNKLSYYFHGAAKVLTITQLIKFEGGIWHSDNLDELPDQISEGSILWIDVEDPTKEEINQLKKRFGIANLNLEELSEEGRRSKIEEEEARVFCFVSFPQQGTFRFRRQDQLACPYRGEKMADFST